MQSNDKKANNSNDIVHVEENQNNKSDVNNEPIDTFLSNLPENMPPEVKRTIRMSMMGASFGGVPSHPLFDKFTPEHVTQYLNGMQKDDDNSFKLISSNRWFFLFYVVLTVVVFCGLIIYLLPRDKAFLDLLFKLIITFAGGFGSGYGIKSIKDRKK